MTQNTKMSGPDSWCFGGINKKYQLLFKTESVNEDVTLGALVMFSFSFHCVLSGASRNRPPPTGPILEILTIDLRDTTGTEATGCSLSYARFTLGESYAGLRRKASLGTLITHSFRGKQKGEFSAICGIEGCDTVRLGTTNQERSLAGCTLLVFLHWDRRCTPITH